MKWNDQQAAALTVVHDWFRRGSRSKPWFYLGGFAGTGKTTLARHLADTATRNVVFGAYTGKAALVMRRRGCKGARTIHSMIYKPVEDRRTGELTFVMNDDVDFVGTSLFVIDECSMVDEVVARDLLSFGVPILVLGDPGQLPPIGSAGYFTSKKPDFMLTEVVRQARDNPIIELASRARAGKVLELGWYGESSVVSKMSSRAAHEASQIIVGKHVTREKINVKMRKIYDFDDELPVKGDKLVCTKNDRRLKLMNGASFIVEKRYPRPTGKTHAYEISDEERKLTVRAHDSCFDGTTKPNWKALQGTAEFDYGYAITCHKSQGSQWPDVLIVDESSVFREDSSKWLYTAITRAAERVTIVKRD